MPTTDESPADVLGGVVIGVRRIAPAPAVKGIPITSILLARESAVTAPTIGVLRIHEDGLDPSLFGLVPHELDQLTVRPLVELLGPASIADVPKILERDV